MSAILSLVAGLLGKLSAPLIALLGSWATYRAGRKAGQAEQRAADAEAGLKEARKATHARSTVGGADSDVDRMLRRPGARD